MAEKILDTPALIGEFPDEARLRDLILSQAQSSVKVEAFGAAGDDSTDDTNAIQGAINEMAERGGGIVLLANATYKITSALVMASNVSLIGTGPGGTILKQYTTNAHGVVTNGTAIAANAAARWQIRDIRFQSAVAFTPGGAGNRAGVAIRVSSAREFYIDNVIIEGADTENNRWAGGIWLEDDAATNLGSRWAVIRGFYIESIADHTGDAGIKLHTAYVPVNGWGHMWQNGIVQTETHTDGTAYTTPGYCGLLNYGSDGTHMESIEFIGFSTCGIFDGSQSYSSFGVLTNSRFKSISFEHPRSNNTCVTFFNGAQQEFWGCNFYGGSGDGNNKGATIDGGAQQFNFTQCWFSSKGNVDVVTLNNAHTSPTGPHFVRCDFNGSGTGGTGLNFADAHVTNVACIGSTFHDMSNAVILNALLGNTNILIIGNDATTNVTSTLTSSTANQFQDTVYIQDNIPPNFNRPKALRGMPSTTQNEKDAVFIALAQSSTGGDDVGPRFHSLETSFTTQTGLQTVFTYQTNVLRAAGGDGLILFDAVVTAYTSNVPDGATFLLRRGYKNLVSALTALGTQYKESYVGAGVTWDCNLNTSGQNIIVQFNLGAGANNPTKIAVACRVWHSGA